MECIELNWLCKQMEKVRSSQAGIPVLNWVKQFFPASVVKRFIKVELCLWDMKMVFFKGQ